MIGVSSAKWRDHNCRHSEVTGELKQRIKSRKAVRLEAGWLVGSHPSDR